MNAESSRSHTIYRLSIESEEVDEDDLESKPVDPSTPGGVTRMSFLNLVDLAGIQVSNIRLLTVYRFRKTKEYKCNWKDT